MLKKILRTLSAVIMLTACLSIAPAQNQGPFNTPRINSTFYVGTVPGVGYATIQSAVTAACTQTGATVVIPASSSPSDTIAGITQACATISVSDERAGAIPAKYTWSGTAFVLVAGTAPPTTKLPAFVQVGSYINGTGAAGVVQLTFSSTGAGDTIFIVGNASGVSGNGFGIIGSATDNQGNSYTVQSGGAGQYASNMSVLWATNIRGGPITINVFCSGTGGATCSARAAEYKNVGAVDVFTGSYGISGSGSSGVTTTHAGDLIINAMVSAVTGTITGFTNRTSATQGYIADEVAPAIGSTPVTITSVSGACCNGVSWGFVVALTNAAQPTITPLVNLVTAFVPGLQTSPSQLYGEVPIMNNTVYIPGSCTGSLASGTIAATGTTAFTIVKHAGGINGTATTLCTATWTASQTAATFTGTGGYLSPGDYLTVVGAGTADATLLNIVVGVDGSR